MCNKWMGLILCCLVGFVLLVGCGGEDVDSHSGHDHDHDGHGSHDDEGLDDTEVASGHLGKGPEVFPVLEEGKGFDPVCGMTIDTADMAKVENNGFTFHFCGDRCEKAFASSPDRYTYCPVTKEKADSTISSEVAGKTYYFCCKKCKSNFNQ